MKIKIEVPYNTYAVLPATSETGLLFAALAQAVLVTESGYGKDKKFERSDDKIKIELIDDAFDAIVPDTFKKLQEQLSNSQSDWHKEYNLRSKAEKELKEVRAKLAALTASVKEVTPEPSKQTDEEPAF